MRIDDFSTFESFEPLINETIALYKSYEQQIDQELLRIDSNHEKNITDNVESSIDNLYYQSSDKFDFLLQKISEFKQKNYLLFTASFKTTNSLTNCLFGFVFKLLSLSMNQNPQIEKLNNSFQHQIFFVNRGLELLSILIPSQNESVGGEDDDEFSLRCCEQLVKSFNFTSSLCSLLNSYLQKPDNSSKQNHKSLLSSVKYFRMAFHFLNKMTLNHKVHTFDYFVSDFIICSANKIIDKSLGVSEADLKPHLQFITNIVRKNKKEFESLLNSKKIYSSFCREISQLLNKPGYLFINACIIFTKLCYEESLPIVLSVDFKYHIDVSLKCLITASLANRDKGKNYEFSRENAAHFLKEFFKRKQVIELLDSNEEYSVLVLLQLNHLLIESDNRSALNASIKVFNMLKTLTENSQKLAEKLFQIIFCTRKIFEEIYSKPDQNSLTKQFLEILSPDGKENDLNYEIFSDYYIRTAKIALNSPLLKDMNNASTYGEMLINEPYFRLSYLEYLLQLFNKNENSVEKKFIKEKIHYLLDHLFENLINLKKLFNSNSMCESNHVFESNKEILSKIFNNTISLIEIVLKFVSPKSLDALEMVKSLFEMIKFNKENTTNCSSTWSIVSDSLILSSDNILLLIRFLVRFVKNNQGNKNIASFNESFNKLFQEDSFLSLISYAIIESDSLELSRLAYGILFEIDKDKNSIKFKFDFKTFLEYNEKIKKQRDCKKENKPIETIYSTGELNNQNDLRTLVDVYECQLNEKSTKEVSILSLINQNLTNISLLDSETRVLSDQLQRTSQNLTEVHNEKKKLETKLAEITESFQEAKKANVNLKKQNQKLLDGKQKLNEQCELQKKESEQIGNDHFDHIDGLQKTLKTERAGRLATEQKLTETERKITDIEKTKKALEKTLKEAESKMQLQLKEVNLQLEDKLTHLDETSSKINTLENDYEGLKSDNEKLKSILSYVKENYK